MSSAVDGQLILVFGGTGNQGGGVIDALLKSSPATKIRVPTRNPESESSKKVIAKGSPGQIECVKADLGDPETVEKAMQGCYGIYLVTNFWQDGMTPEKEIEQAKMVLDKAVANGGIKHIVFSTLPDTRNFPEMSDDKRLKRLMGNYLVPHYDGKGEAMELFHAQDKIPIDGMNCAFYMDNFFGQVAPQGGVFLLPFGDRKQSVIAVQDIGKAGAALFVRGPPSRVTGSNRWPEHNLAGEQLTITEIAEKWTKTMKEEAKYQDPGLENFVQIVTGFGVPEPVAADLCQMYAFHQTEAYIKMFTPNDLKALVPDAMDFDTFLQSKAK